MKINISALALTAALALPLTSQAASIDVNFDPAFTTITGLNQTFSIDIMGNYNADLTDSLLGGALDLSFDSSILNVNSIILGAPADIGSSTGVIDNLVGFVDTIGFATFIGINDGPFTFATIEFESVGFGSSLLQLSDSNDFLFTWVNSNFDLVPVNATDGSVNVMQASSPMPLPATIWLFLAGLGGLGAIAHHRVKPHKGT